MDYDKTQVDVKNKTFRDQAGNTVQRRQVTTKRDVEADSVVTTQHIVYLIYGIMAALMGIRILLSLLAANRANGFAHLIYSLTGWMVAPFRSLFSINTNLGQTGSHFEIETVVAILAWGLAAWIIMRIVGVKREAADE